MKAGKPHIVPLVPAALAILQEARGLFTGKDTDPVSPGLKGKPLSDATLAKPCASAGAGMLPFTASDSRSAIGRPIAALPTLGQRRHWRTATRKRRKPRIGGQPSSSSAGTS